MQLAVLLEDSVGVFSKKTKRLERKSIVFRNSQNSFPRLGRAAQKNFLWLSRVVKIFSSAVDSIIPLLCQSSGNPTVKIFCLLIQEEIQPVSNGFSIEHSDSCFVVFVCRRVAPPFIQRQSRAENKAEETYTVDTI